MMKKYISLAKALTLVSMMIAFATVAKADVVRNIGWTEDNGYYCRHINWGLTQFGDAHSIDDTHGIAYHLKYVPNEGDVMTDAGLRMASGSTVVDGKYVGGYFEFRPHSTADYFYLHYIGNMSEFEVRSSLEVDSNKLSTGYDVCPADYAWYKPFFQHGETVAKVENSVSYNNALDINCVYYIVFPFDATGLTITGFQVEEIWVPYFAGDLDVKVVEKTAESTKLGVDVTSNGKFQVSNLTWYRSKKDDYQEAEVIVGATSNEIIVSNETTDEYPYYFCSYEGVVNTLWYSRNYSKICKVVFGAGLSVASSTVDVNLGVPAALPPTRVAYETESTGVLSVVAADASIASVELDTKNKTLIITPHKEGQTTLTLSQAEADGFPAGQCRLVVNVHAVENYETAPSKEDIVDAPSSWALTNVQNNGLLNKLYWNVHVSNKAAITGTNGLGVTSDAYYFFQLPADNNGGVLTVTYGSTVAGATTSLKVNGVSKSVTSVADGEATQQKSWLIPADTKQVMITMGDATADGVITSMSWFPGPDLDRSVDAYPGRGAKYSIVTEGIGEGEISKNRMAGSVYQKWWDFVHKFTCEEDRLIEKVIVHVVSCSYDRNGMGDKLTIAVGGNSQTFDIPSADSAPSTCVVVPAYDCTTFTVSGAYAFYYVEVYTKTANPTSVYTRTGVTPKTVSTICLPYAVEEGGYDANLVQFYEIADKEVVDGSNKVYFQEATKLEAGRPYLFYSDETQFDLVYTSEVALAPGNFNGLYGSYDKFVFGDHQFVSKKYSILSGGQIKNAGKTSSAGAFRAYVKMANVPEKSTNKASVRRLVLTNNGFEVVDNATSIETISTNDFDACTYDLYGRVSNGTNGLMVKSGKLILVK